MLLKPRDRSEVYDKLYALADKLLQRSRACANCPIGEAVCKTKEGQQYTKNWCCGGCPHTSPTGCTVQALGCKLWLCQPESMKVSGAVYFRLNKLKQIAQHYGIYLARADKAQSLEHGMDKPFWYIYFRDSKQ